MDRPAVPRVLGERGRAGRGPECPSLGPPLCAPLHTPLASLMFQPVSGRRGSAGQGLGTAAPGPPSATLVLAEDGPAGPCRAGGVARVRVPTRPRDDHVISECSVSLLNTTDSSSCRPLGPDATSEWADFPSLCRAPAGEADASLETNSCPEGLEAPCPSPSVPLAAAGLHSGRGQRARYRRESGLSHTSVSLSPALIPLLNLPKAWQPRREAVRFSDAAPSTESMLRQR